MSILTLDVETTHMEKSNGGTTALPYFGNRLVSVGYKHMGSPTEYLCFYHSSKKPDDKGSEILQDVLNKTTILVGHNVKFDITWLRSCGFKYEKLLYDTMVAEYILARSRRWALSLDALAKKYNVTEAQILLRWGVQKGYPVLPKSTNQERIRLNMDLFSFEIDQGDMSAIEDMDRGDGIAWASGDPSMVT